MGSDALWQDENGFSREVRGDYSTVNFGGESSPFFQIFNTFAAASFIAKTFPGTTIAPREGEELISGKPYRVYWVDSEPYLDTLTQQAQIDFEYGDYAAALRKAQLLDAGF